ncbi:MAG: hypothetical protein ABJA66_18745, partial [Actinomycetota bacterium]
NSMLKLKLSAVAAFLAFASCVFLFPNNKIEAQTNENIKKRDEILEKVAFYKIWQQVIKKEDKSFAGILKTSDKLDVLTISDSSVAG